MDKWVGTIFNLFPVAMLLEHPHRDQISALKKQLVNLAIAVNLCFTSLNKASMRSQQAMLITSKNEI
jgi:hypothetical protein